MKLNKKGMTLVELIISMALISIVLTFMYRLILDVNYEKNNTGFASDNQINRAEIIRTIEEDFIAKELIKVVKNNDNEIVFTYANGENKTISITDGGKKITYGNNKAWEIPDENYYYSFGTSTADFTSSTINFYVKIPIEVKSDAAKVNTIDDINLYYLGTWNDSIKKENFILS